MEPEAIPGHATRELDRASRVLAGVAPALISIGAGALALTVVPGGNRPAATLAVVVVATWRVVFVTGVLRGRGTGRLLAADATATAGIALAQRWVDAPYLVADSAGWVQALVVATAVSYPWLAPTPRSGLAAAAAVAVAFGAGASLAVGPDPLAVVLPAAWVLGDALVSAAACRLVRLGARRADEATARRERARADLGVEEARRAAEREHLAALHDTAAATLLVVGTGAVADGDGRLAAQAGRDLAVLRRVTPAPGTTSLRALLRDAAAGSDLDVHLHDPGHDVVLPARVAAAIVDAVREALRNVRRHAGVEDVVVEMSALGGGVRVDVADAGRGLPVAPPAPGIAPGTARGVRHSIVGRLAAVGGAATVGPRPGGGVLVRLEWPGGPG